MRYELKSLQETRDWAAQFAQTLRAPRVVALHGDLGMGKSEIARAVIQTLSGADTVVPSPTFTLVQNYDGISHFDLYRVRDAAELEEIGLAESCSRDICLIEWPEIALGFLPPDTIHIYISEINGGRELTIGPRR
ncbi:MAG: tRNA (adenosine(37)-N6)-threonylcarbamoyltransferase complex ATPase subunit type 1 TsaE [Rickettsiales bacterium]|jgi:tRNA threonylcarbamoyl adenosine modification protein YjeE|nr:tRNA (adenosine(37)-N6)-threonylcarbamoyltransferase complex ATPase subunit type 1 TsaE [Rickettsiales bacterium]